MRNDNLGLWIGIILLVFIGGGAAYYLMKPDASSKPAAATPAKAGAAPTAGAQMPPSPVESAQVERKNIAVTLAAIGTISASESAEVHSEIAGKIEKIEFQEGQSVQKGDILLEIDSSLIRTELTKAEAALKVRRSTYNRDQELHKSKYIASQELDESKASLQEAEAEANAARIRLNKARIIAPFDGVVGLRNFSVGDYVNIGQMLTTIDAVDPMKIEFSVPEKNFSDLHEGQKITFAVDAWPELFFEGEVYALDARVDPKTRSFQVKAMVSNAENKLRSGMFARLQIATSFHENALVIPEEAIIPKGEQNFVYLIEDGAAKMAEVTTGLRENGMVEILTGLNDGQEIVTAGALKIRDGAKVMAQPRTKPTENLEPQAPATDPQ